MTTEQKQPTTITRKQLAAIFRERIYGSITVLAVNIGMLVKISDGLTIKHAFITIISTVFGLWLAGIFSSVLSHKIVHEKNMTRSEFAHELLVHRGLLMAGWSSIIMLTLAAFGAVSLYTAILADIALTVIAFTITLLRGTKVNSNTLITTAISVGIQALVIAAIILLKLEAK